MGTGTAGTTQILNAESLRLATSEVDPLGPRSYAFRAGQHCVLTANGYFTTYMQRDKLRCQNIVVLPQMVIENPDFGIGNVQLCDYQYYDVTTVRNYLVNKLKSLPSGCNPPPAPPAPRDAAEAAEPADS